MHRGGGARFWGRVFSIFIDSGVTLIISFMLLGALQELASKTADLFFHSDSQESIPLAELGAAFCDIFRP